MRRKLSAAGAAGFHELSPGLPAEHELSPPTMLAAYMAQATFVLLSVVELRPRARLHVTNLSFPRIYLM